MCNEPEESIVLSLSEDGVLTTQTQPPLLIFQMDMEKAIAFIRALHTNEKYKDFFDEIPFTMENVDVEEFISRVKKLNDEGTGAMR